MSQTRIFEVGTTLLCLFQAWSVSAHHSRAEFAEEVQEMEGEIVRVNWANPHPTFEIDIATGGGAEERWEVQAFGSVYTLARGGVSGDVFSPGERVTIAGQVSTRRDNVLLASNMLLATGDEVVLNGGADPYWNQSGIGGRANWAVAESDLVDAAAEDLGLFRVWSQPHRDGATAASALEGAISLHLPFNAAALARRAEWDPLDDPDMQCMPKGMPVVMVTPHPFTFSQAGPNIRIFAHEYAVERIIYLEDAPDPGQLPPSPVGYSVGHWEGDTLVVETTDIAWNYFFFGFGLGDNVEVVERMTLSDDQSQLDYSAVFTDSDTFTESATITRYWVALGETPPPFDCTPAG